MISEHPCFTPPENHEVKLWRYMDLAKFVSILQMRSLFFTRANELGDPFEGSLTRMNVNIRDYILTHRATDDRLILYRDMTDEQIMLMNIQSSGFAKQSIQNMFVSCWHMNDHESAAMWSIYSNSNDSVCIRTTFARLCEHLPSYTYAGAVNYIDYNTDVIPAGNAFYPIMHKRNYFRHEQEVRAVCWELISAELGGDYIRSNATASGLHIPVDISSLIEAVHVNPTSQSWFHDVVKGIASDYGVTAPVVRSSIAGAPWY